MDALDEYMRFARDAPFGFEGLPQLDCCTYLANACKVQRGVDPGIPFHNLYKSETEAVLLFGPKGLPRFMDSALKDVGVMPTKEPMRGDIACVDVLGTVCGAVCWRGAWWTKSSIGLGRFRADQIRIIRAWKASC